jgi:homoserine dehydrogenase
MSLVTYRIALAGLGNVGASLLNILHCEADSLRTRYGVEFLLTGVAELGGGAIDPQGLDLALLLHTLQKQQPVAELPSVGRPGMSAIDMIKLVQADFFLEATPVNLQHGQPGLDNVRFSLQQGMHTILANKGPVALAFEELAGMSDLGYGWGRCYRPDFQPTTGCSPVPKLRFNACVAGSLPTVNMGLRDLAGCRVQRMEAIFNGTTQYILRAMENNQSYAEALADTQRRGIAEADPTLDVDGWDAAAKLVIAANAVLGQSAQLSDVVIQGVREVTAADIQQALDNNERIVLLCLADYVDGRYQLSVKPAPLPMEHPLCQLTPDEMAVVYYTQDVERLFTASSEPGPEPAAAAMLRDMLDIIYSNLENRV